MTTQFAHDLRVARRKAGLLQSDVAHLLTASRTVVSDLEHGRYRPTLEQTVMLSLIFGRSFESLFDELMRECRGHLNKQLKTLPELEDQTGRTFNRSDSLSRLQSFLTKEQG